MMLGVVALVAGCTRAGFELTRQVSDRGDGPLSADARTDDALGIFSLATPIAALATEAAANDGAPSFTADLLELYFESENRPGFDSQGIWVSTRATKNAPWGAPMVVAELSTTSREGNPVVSPDGLTLVFSSDRPPGIDWDIWISTRSQRSDRWSTPTRLAELDAGSDDIPCTITNDRKLMILQRGYSDQTNLMMSRRTDATADWEAPQPISQLNTPGFDSHGAMTSDGLVIVFDSERDGGRGLRDLYLAQRSASDARFDSIAPLSEFNTAANDSTPRLSDDRRYIIFARSPVGSIGIFSGPSRLLEASR